MKQRTASTSTAPSYALTVGIDWADQAHAVCVRRRGDSTPELSALDHRPEAIHEWGKQLRRQVAHGRIAIALEQSKGALFYALMEYDFIDLYPVTPQMIASYSKAFAVSGAKDDPTDAVLLEQLLCTHWAELRIWVPMDLPTRTLQLLCRKRRQLVEERTRLSNALRAQLKEFLPQAIELLDPDLARPMVCAFLTKWSSFQALRRARPQTIRQFFYAHRCRSEKRLQERLDLIARAVPLTEDPAVLELGILTVEALVAQLQELATSIARFEVRIAEILSTHPEGPIFQSLPGAGANLAPRLLSIFGSDRTRWTHSTELQTGMGIAPVLVRSGRRTVVRHRIACSKYDRQTLHEFAHQSIYYSVWAKAYYELQRGRGRPHHTVIRSLAFKWLRIIFRCWKNRTPYDEITYLKALQRRGAPLLAYISHPDSTAMN